MATTAVQDLRTKSEAAWHRLSRQLEGMEPHLERADAPGEWTTREVLSHLLFDPGWDAAGFLRKFSERDLPLGEIVPGRTAVTPERKAMTLRQFLDTLNAQRQGVLAYLESLPEADLHRRKARIPFLKQYMGTEEISLLAWAGLLLDMHWQDHAGQLAKIRKAVGLPEAA